MTEADIERAWQNALKAVSLPGDAQWNNPLGALAWQNHDAPQVRPYASVQIVRVSTTTPTMAGLAKLHRGYVIVTAVTDFGGFTDDGMEIADAVAAAFPMARRLTAGDGQVTITKPPETLQGFRDGPDWRQPVRIDYQAS
jgi:hypothetical protein